ncbi:MAG: hypothetical protein L0K02_05695 [Corynebacterium sp.]|nr:hypothetical protein [Corynebacterium sp.]
MVDVADRVHIWKNAEVYISIVGAEDPKAEADGTFGDDWLQVGILADGSSIGQERDADRTEIMGWSSQLIATDQKFKKDTRSFTTLEDNEVVWSLMWPNSEYPVDGTPTVVLAPQDAQRHIGFRTTDQHGNVHVEVSRLEANIYPSSMDKADDGASTTEFTSEIRKDADGALYDKAVFSGTGVSVVTPDVIRFKTDDSGE